ncbi:MAG: RNA-guided pseudouridylation complex pseudouridine synthase subunit Cbf5 [Candidatus Aenigmatarchaeota archaeon]
MEEVLVKSEEVSDPRFGEYPGARKIEELIENGIVVIDKPSGPTSHQVTSWVRDMLKLKKAGHSGTLDPKTTGVLVIALEKATKIMKALMGLDKEYISIMHLHKNVPDKKLQITLDNFEGEILQKPPVKSSVKREERIREVHGIDILDRDGNDVLIRVKCEAGTYIRKLIHDAGEQIGGAHMKELRRTKVGPFTEDMSYKLQDLKDSYVLWKKNGNDSIRSLIGPVESGAEHLRWILVKDTAIDSICHGAPLGVGGVSKLHSNIEKGDMVQISSLKGELIAIGKAEMDSQEIFESGKGKAAELERVIMNRNTYPSSWKNV